MNLSNLTPATGAVKKGKRVGRGQGSGRGGTSTRGHKGAGSRSGYSTKIGFEGGQMPIQRRVPKYGFKNINRLEYTPVNLQDLQRLAESNNIATFTFENFQKFGLVSKTGKVKILGSGDIKSAFEVHAHAFSETAKNAIESKGGKAINI